MTVTIEEIVTSEEKLKRGKRGKEKERKMRKRKGQEWGKGKRTKEEDWGNVCTLYCKEGGY